MAQLKYAYSWGFCYIKLIEEIINNFLPMSIELTIIQSSGRAGSTLIYKILTEKGLPCISEPAIFCNSFKTQLPNIDTENLYFTLRSFSLVTDSNRFALKLKGQHAPFLKYILYS